MKQINDDAVGGPRNGRFWQRTMAWSGWRALGGTIGLGVAGLVFASAPGSAQTPEDDPPSDYFNHHTGIDSGLTMARLRAMATATRTEQAGRQMGGSVYVPSQCVGTRRCPLVILSQPSVEMMTPVADKYGFILTDDRLNNHTLDALLGQLLGKFAIDLDKIVLMGNCAGVGWVMGHAARNLDAYSRAVMMLGPTPPATGVVAPPNGKTEFYIEYGLHDGFPLLVTAHQLLRAGHRVTMVIGVRPHIQHLAAYYPVGQWLTESWAIPDPAARPAPDTMAEVGLTVEALAKMTAFWRAFIKEKGEHDYDPVEMVVPTADRLAHLRRLAVPYPNKELRPVTWIMDTPALAAKFPKVAELLKQAGLTAQQHDEYRLALITALTSWAEWKNYRLPAVPSTSVLGRNMAFVDAHPDELAALEETAIWRTP